MASKSLHDDACQGILDEADDLNTLSQSIWSHPELNYEEQHAHDALCEFLEKRDFKVERKYTGVETAFRASWHNPKAGQDISKLPHVVVISEYDALPDIGHACGHNLIAQVGVASALGVKAALEKQGKSLGKITVMGTPAEEGGGGKIKLIDNGAFDDVDVALMVHPAPFNMVTPTIIASTAYTVTYKGFASHAAGAPWEGLNALDAVVMAYNGMSALRQQLKPTVRIHSVIRKGGVKANIIPDLTEMELMMRDVTGEGLDQVIEKVTKCLKGAAMSTGCELEMRCEMPGMYYLDMNHNGPLTALYAKHMKTVDPQWVAKEDPAFSGSTDMGNVSQVVPSIHPFYSIGKAVNHSRDFTAVAGSPAAQTPTMDQAKTLAMMALDVMSDQALLKEVKEDFLKTSKK